MWIWCGHHSVRNNPLLLLLYKYKSKTNIQSKYKQHAQAKKTNLV